MEPARDIPAIVEGFGRGKDYAPDERRKHLLWIAAAVIAALGIAVVVLAAYGDQGPAADYSDPLLLIGLLAFLTCAVAYFTDKEREHRADNRRLIYQLHQTAQALDQRVERLNRLCETSTHLAGALSMERVSELVVEALVGQVQADAASLVLLDSKGSCVHELTRGVLAEIEDGQDTPAEVAKAAAEDAAPAIRVLSSSTDLAEQLAAWGRTRATISAPMKVSGLIGGALAAMRQDDFSSEDLNLLTTLANMAAKAIESVELHEQLRQSYFRTLHVLAHSLAARDPYSAAHGEAVAWLACRLAEKLDLGPDALEPLRAYTPLHDLGKIGITDAVLLKEGPLTEKEVILCRQHTVIGEEIIRPLNPGSVVLSMIRNHHERWDGGGYPDRLAGEQIPILARVVGVADSFHAMTSHRPYKSGAVAFDAVQEIRALAGSQFDPAVAAAMAELWESGEVAKFSMRSAEAESMADMVGQALPVFTPPSPAD